MQPGPVPAPQLLDGEAVVAAVLRPVGQTRPVGPDRGGDDGPPSTAWSAPALGLVPVAERPEAATEIERLVDLLAAFAGYSFAKFDYPAKKPLMLLILSAQMFPFGVLLISIYPMLQSVGLLDTRIGLTVSYIVFALPVSTYMMYSYFKQVPNELIEAAHVDGASNFKIFRRIVMPISLPAFITVALYAFMWSWNDLLYSMTLASVLVMTFLGEASTNWGYMMAASIVAAVPVTVIFVFLQRCFIQGFTADAVKG